MYTYTYILTDKCIHNYDGNEDNFLTGINIVDWKYQCEVYFLNTILYSQKKINYYGILWMKQWYKENERNMDLQVKIPFC